MIMDFWKVTVSRLTFLKTHTRICNVIRFSFVPQQHKENKQFILHRA